MIAAPSLGGMIKRPYHNNLVQNDRVFVVSLQRHGKVATTPQKPDYQRKTAVLLDGTNTQRYFDVADLRLTDGGKILEDVPPIDGDLPEEVERLRPALQPRAESGAIEALREEKARNDHAMRALDQQHRGLRAANDRIDRAIAVLTAPA